MFDFPRASGRLTFGFVLKKYAPDSKWYIPEYLKWIDNFLKLCFILKVQWSWEFLME